MIHYGGELVWSTTYFRSKLLIQTEVLIQGSPGRNRYTCNKVVAIQGSGR